MMAQAATQSALEVFKGEFEKHVEVWKGIFASGRIGTEYAALSAAECEVFGIDPDRWPRLCALWEAFEDVRGICDMGGYGQELGEAVAAAVGLPEREPIGEVARISKEQLQALGQVVGVGYREGDALFTKMHFWEVRAGLTRYKDEREGQVSLKEKMKDLPDEIPF